MTDRIYMVGCTPVCGVCSYVMVVEKHPSHEDRTVRVGCWKVDCSEHGKTYEFAQPFISATLVFDKD